MNAKDEGKQCEHEWNWDRSRCFKCLLELSDYLNALQQQLADLQAERDRYREALERIADREGMPWPQYRKKWNLIPWWDGTDSLSGAQIARDALTSPSAIAQRRSSDEQRNN